MSDAPTALRPRARRRAKQHALILRTSRRLVVDEGLAALTIQRLARELDFTPGALYRYFASKEALLAELQTAAFEVYHQQVVDLAQRVEEVLARSAPKTRAVALLLAIGRLQRELPLTAPAESRLLAGMLADPRPLISDPSLTQGPAGAFVALLEAVVVALEGAVREHALRRGDAIDRALTWVGAVQGVLQLGKLNRFDSSRFDPTRLADSLTETLLSGWGLSATDRRRAATLLTRLEHDGLLSRRPTPGAHAS